jgi:hypothetical protein
MKIRTGFVSNSSASSFYCDLCGTETEVYDSDDLYLYDLGICPFGHHMHREDVVAKNISTDDIVDQVSVQDMIDYMEESSGYLYLLEEEMEELKELCGKIEDKNLPIISFCSQEYLKNTVRNIIPKKMCPICQNKKVAYANIIKFLLHKLGFQNLGEAEEFMLKRYKTSGVIEALLKDADMEL